MLQVCGCANAAQLDAPDAISRRESKMIWKSHGLMQVECGIWRGWIWESGGMDTAAWLASNSEGKLNRYCFWHYHFRIVQMVQMVRRVVQAYR